MKLQTVIMMILVICWAFWIDNVTTAVDKKVTSSHDGNSARLDSASTGDLWPNAIIPYEISKDLVGVENIIHEAMQEYMHKTCVVFTPAGSVAAAQAGHNNSVMISEKDSCSSCIGGYHGHNCTVGIRIVKDKFGNKTINCPVFTGYPFGSALHILGHVVSLVHEHNRLDRDDYVKIWRANIKPKSEHKFNKNHMITRELKYDFCSIMHYGHSDFSLNHKFTIVTRDQDYQYTIGSAKHLSFFDAELINLLYGCNHHCPSDESCKQPCYVNHQCKCLCPVKDECPKMPCDKNASPEVCDGALKFLGKDVITGE